MKLKRLSVPTFFHISEQIKRTQFFLAHGIGPRLMKDSSLQYRKTPVKKMTYLFNRILLSLTHPSTVPNEKVLPDSAQKFLP